MAYVWQPYTMKNTNGWENEIAILSKIIPSGSLSTVYRPTGGRLVNEMDLHYDAGKISRLHTPVSHERKSGCIFESHTL